MAPSAPHTTRGAPPAREIVRRDGSQRRKGPGQGRGRPRPRPRSQLEARVHLCRPRLIQPPPTPVLNLRFRPNPRGSALRWFLCSRTGQGEASEGRGSDPGDQGRPPQRPGHTAKPLSKTTSHVEEKRRAPTIGTKGPRRHDPKTPPAGSADTQVAGGPHSHHATTTTKIRNTPTEHAGTTPSTPPRGPRTRRRTLTEPL